MKRIISLLISILLISSVLVVPSFANDVSDCAIDYVTGEVTVDITLSGVRSGVFVPFFDLNPNYTHEDVIPVTKEDFTDAICHYDYLITDKDGVITYTYTPTDAKGGLHKLFYISPVNSQVNYIGSGYTFYDDNTKAEILDEFNNATSKLQVKELINTYHQILGIETLDITNIDTISACIFKDKNIKKFTKVTDFINAYNLGLSIVKLNAAQDVIDFFTALEEEQLMDDFSSISSANLIDYLTDDEDVLAVYDAILEKDLEHFYDVEETFTHEVILRIVEKAKNNTYIESAILNNTKYLKGLNTKNVSALNQKAGLSGVSSQLIHKTFDTIELFVQRVNSLVSQQLNKLNNAGSSSSKDDFSSNSGFSSVAQNPYTPEEETSSLVFTDMADSMWAAEAVGTLVNLGIINGKAKNTFAPNDYITREEFVKIIVEAFDYNLTSDVSFTDVTSSDWCYNYIKRAVASDIINGISATEFGKGKYITREDICVILQRALSKYETLNSSVNSFADNSLISDYAKDSVSKLSNIGVVTGFGDNTFKPQSNATRAQAAVMVYRALNIKGVQ